LKGVQWIFIWFLLLVGCGGTPPEIPRKTAELVALKRDLQSSQETVRELPKLFWREEELKKEKASLLQRKRKLGGK